MPHSRASRTRPFSRGQRAERDARIVAFYRKGNSLAQIARAHQLSVERIRQIVLGAGERGRLSASREFIEQLRPLVSQGYKAGLSVADISVQARCNTSIVRRVLRSEFDYICRRRYGVSRKEMQAALGSQPDSLLVERAYSRCRYAAHTNHSPWTFTLLSWWKVWRSSGHWRQACVRTGKRHGYIMERRNTRQAWSARNVHVVMRYSPAGQQHALRNYARGPYYERYGMTKAQYDVFRSRWGKLCPLIIHRYVQTRYFAKRRGEDWNLGLVEWTRICRRALVERALSEWSLHRFDLHCGWQTGNVHVSYDKNASK